MSYFKDYLNQFNDKQINIFIDMDGVVADYDALSFKIDQEKDDAYLTKRPIYSTINILKEISGMNNITLYILSCTKKDSQKEGKVLWLSKYMNFIKKENINLISREEKENMKSCLIKSEFLKKHYDSNKINIVIDDAHDVIKEVMNLDINIIPLHISSILD